MSEEEQTRQLIKAIDGYVEFSEDTKDLNYIGQILNHNDFDAGRVALKFSFLLQHFESSKIEKALEVIEFLVQVNSQKLEPIIEDEKFMEQFASVVWEIEFQNKALQLIKLLNDIYDVKQKEMERLFEFISNLQAMEMYIPSQFHSKFQAQAEAVGKDIDVDGLPHFMKHPSFNPNSNFSQMANNHGRRGNILGTSGQHDSNNHEIDSTIAQMVYNGMNKQPSSNQGEDGDSDQNTQSYPPRAQEASNLKIQDMPKSNLPDTERTPDDLQMAKNVLNEINQCFFGEEFAKSSHQVQITRILDCMSNRLRMVKKIEGLKESSQWDSIKDQYEPIYEELQAVHPKLTSKYSQLVLQIPESMLQESNQYDIQQPMLKLPFTSLLDDDDDDDEEDDDEDEGEVGDMELIDIQRPMGVHEYMFYKTERCPRGMNCKYAPDPNKLVEESFKELGQEIFCKRWHNFFDKRRNFYNTLGNKRYNAQHCQDILKLGTCKNGESCQNSHNNYEASFHPSKYKKIQCPRGGACDFLRFCVKYHDFVEKRSWQAHRNNYFKDFENEVTINPEPKHAKDDYSKFIDLSDDENKKGKHHQNTTAPDNDLDYLTDEAYKESQGNGLLGAAGGVGRYHTSPKFGGKKEAGLGLLGLNSRKFKDEQEDKPEEYKNNLSSSLVIKKKFEDPCKLTNFFSQNKIYNGLPLVSVLAGGDQQQKGGNDEEK